MPRNLAHFLHPFIYFEYLLSTKWAMTLDVAAVELSLIFSLLFIGRCKFTNP
jgi:hypothetical protein